MLIQIIIKYMNKIFQLYKEIQYIIITNILAELSLFIHYYVRSYISYLRYLSVLLH